MTAEHHDVLIVGAGLSGVGMGCHLRRHCPGTTFAILEARAALGGTWDLFRYPGIRSDSDMFTLGYAFKPWRNNQAIAAGADIRNYICEAAKEYGVDAAIRYRRQVVGAQWSSADNRWTLQVRCDNDDRRLVTMTCSFVFLATGYYRYDEGYTPDFPGRETFKGRIVHPQHWPDDLDYSDKRVVVIGSGATAMTLVPALAQQASLVTMLQRSPTYIVSRPAADPLSKWLRLFLSDRATYKAIRAKNVLLSSLFYRLSRRRPEMVKHRILEQIKKELPNFDVETHFTPSYDPWDQRVCLVPDSDLFAAIRAGRVDVVTDHIERFVDDGIALRSGRTLTTDIIVTATGLTLQLHGGMTLRIDGQPVNTSALVSYKGMMLCGVPNLAFATGYTNASWTLKLDLVAEYVCQLVNHMTKRGYQRCIPQPPEPTMPLRPALDLQSGYVRRGVDAFPKQGDRAPWQLHQNYLRDLRLLRFGEQDLPYLQFDTTANPPTRQVSDKQPAA